MAPKRVLLVDDEPDIREVARISLEMVGGWTVLTETSGAAALVRAAAERPDAILLDVMMPDLDGPTTLERLRTDPATADIPVIFLTAKLQASDQRHFESLGVAGVIPKPFDPMALARQVAEALGWTP